MSQENALSDMSDEEFARITNDLDPDIAPAVRALHAAGIQTWQSCQGGEGHSYPEPTIEFGAFWHAGEPEPEVDWKLALCTLRAAGFVVASISRTYTVEGDEAPERIWTVVLRPTTDPGRWQNGWWHNRHGEGPDDVTLRYRAMPPCAAGVDSNG